MTIVMILIQCTIIALQYIAGGSILASILPDIFDMKTATFFSFLIFMLVGFVGGMGSASISNILNISLIYIGVIVSSIVVLINQGGWEAAKQMAIASPDVPYMSLPPVIAGLTLSGLWVVDMSTACSMLIGCSTTVSQDIFFKTKFGEKFKHKSFMINKIIILTVGFLTYILSSQLGTILSAMKVSLSMAIGSSVVVIAGIWCPKFAGKSSGFFTIISSLFVAGAWLVSPSLHDIFKDIGYLMLLVSLTTFIITSLLEKNKATKILEYEKAS